MSLIYYFIYNSFFYIVLDVVEEKNVLVKVNDIVLEVFNVNVILNEMDILDLNGIVFNVF